MKKFLQYISLFALPVFILGGLSEFLLRNIPNDYLLKKEFLDHNSDSIHVLFLGNSHAFYDINPAVFSSNSFNASHIAQSLDYDSEILKKYRNNWKNLKCIVIPISYLSFVWKLENEVESWRVKNYRIYYEMNTANKISDYTETLSNKFSINLRRIYSYYINDKSNLSSSSLGWGVDYNSKDKKDLAETGKAAAKRHSQNDDKEFQENVNVLKSIIEFAKSRDITVLLYTPPAYHTYVENLDSAQLNKTLSAVKGIETEYTNVAYHNFLYDKSFSESDFYDADHLNEIGAIKFTHKMDSLVNQNKQTTWR